jgi:hypothetical protein
MMSLVKLFITAGSVVFVVICVKIVLLQCAKQEGALVMAREMKWSKE